MAQRRMFNRAITTSDTFIDMPISSQLLYFHLGMEADDEGFIGNAKMLSRAYGANSDDLKLLEAKRFIIRFDSGVVVIKDWNINNRIRKDRRKASIYTEEKSSLIIDNNEKYQLVNQMTTNQQPNDNQVTTKCPHRLVEDSLVKDSLGEDSLVVGHSVVTDNVIAESNNEVEPTTVANVFSFYQENFGQINSFLSENINQWINDVGEPLVLRAMEITIMRNKRSFGYTTAILKDWQSRNVKTLQDVDALVGEFERKKGANNNATNQGNNRLYADEYNDLPF